MFNNYTCNAVTGSTGGYTLWGGLDLTQLRPECVLGETPMVDKEIKLESKKYTVSDLLSIDKGLKYDLILRMMMKDGVMDYDTLVQVGTNGRLREVYLVKEKEAYRIWGQTYYGKMKK